MGYERMLSVTLIVLALLLFDAVIRVTYGDDSLYIELNNRQLFVALSPAHKHDSDQSTRNKIPESNMNINPHWDKSLCKICHGDNKKEDLSIIGLKNIDELCLDCHKDDISHIYIHPTGLELTKKRKDTISKQWKGTLRLDDGKRLTCLTCHDLLDQCLPDRSHQAKRNPQFLRGGPYANRYTLCYRCHDSSQYERNNPHDQIADSGLLKIKKCRLCHEVDINNNVRSGIERDLEQYPLLKDMNEDRTLLCVRCHKKIDHPSSGFRFRSEKKYRHLVKINSEKKKTLDKQELETGVELPIEPYTGRIYCGTCHQPHQPGVFVGELPTSVTMENHRLRSKPICKHCHDLYGTLLDAGKE